MSQQAEAATGAATAWQELSSYLERDPQGRDLLRSIRTDSQGSFETWLRERQDALPPAIQVEVSGGQMRDLWNIARVNTLNVYMTPPSAAEQREQRNRSGMLEQVDRVWVRGWLEQSVAQPQRLPIELELAPSAVPDPWADLVDRPPAAQPAPAPASVLDAYNTLGRGLLILGAPGAGKTTALLELARALITRAELKPADPIPVVFLLASWAVQRPAFAHWPVDELVKRYRLSRSLSEAWVNGDRIIPLLDGLDEVPVEARAACVEAINQFQTNRQESLTELVVTSRYDEYVALGTQLNLPAAVRLKPLSDAAIEAQLASAGAPLEGVRRALEGDRTLRDLASTPMVLDLLMRTYRNVEPSSLPTSGDTPVRLEQLFAAYAELMLGRRTGAAHYTRAQAIVWLRWLANALAGQSQTVPYIERMQPDWLATGGGRVLYPLVDRLGFGALLGVLEGVVAGLFLNPLFATGFGMVVAIAVALSGRITEGNRSIQRVIGASLLGGLAVGGLTFVLIGLVTRQWSDALVTGVLAGAMIGAPLTGLAGGPWLRPRRIQLVERVVWSVSRALRSVAGSLSAVAILALILVLSVLGQRQELLTLGLLVAMALGVPPALVSAVLGGFDSKDLDDERKRLLPNQGIHHGGQTALLAAGLSALASGASIVLMFGVFGQFFKPDIGTILGGPLGGLLANLPPNVQVTLVLGLILASLYGLIGGLAYGGYAYMSHYALRLALWRERAMPLDYARFLNYASERVLLRRVGGGYMFVHRLLQDYFCEVSPDLRSSASPTSQSG